MSVDYKCPWCGEEFEYWCECGANFTETCSTCEKQFEVTVEYDPLCYVSIPDELKGCSNKCTCWDNSEDCCIFPKYYWDSGAIERHPDWGLAEGPLSSCPIGHKKEAGEEQ